MAATYLLGSRLSIEIKKFVNLYTFCGGWDKTWLSCVPEMVFAYEKCFSRKGSSLEISSEETA